MGGAYTAPHATPSRPICAVNTRSMFAGHHLRTGDRLRSRPPSLRGAGGDLERLRSAPCRSRSRSRPLSRSSPPSQRLFAPIRSRSRSSRLPLSPWSSPCRRLDLWCRSGSLAFSSRRAARSALRASFSRRCASLAASLAAWARIAAFGSTAAGEVADGPAGARGVGVKPLRVILQHQYLEWSSHTAARTHSATASASSSCSLICLSSSARASSSVLPLLYQVMSLFFCHRPTGARMLCPR